MPCGPPFIPSSSPSPTLFPCLHRCALRLQVVGGLCPLGLLSRCCTDVRPPPPSVHCRTYLLLGCTDDAAPSRPTDLFAPGDLVPRQSAGGCQSQTVALVCFVCCCTFCPPPGGRHPPRTPACVCRRPTAVPTWAAFSCHLCCAAARPRGTDASVTPGKLLSTFNHQLHLDAELPFTKPSARAPQDLSVPPPPPPTSLSHSRSMQLMRSMGASHSFDISEEGYRRGMSTVDFDAGSSGVCCVCVGAFFVAVDVGNPHVSSLALAHTRLPTFCVHVTAWR